MEETHTLSAGLWLKHSSLQVCHESVKGPTWAPVVDQHLHISRAESEPAVQVEAGTLEIRCVQVRVDKQSFLMNQSEGISQFYSRILSW